LAPRRKDSSPSPDRPSPPPWAHYLSGPASRKIGESCKCRGHTGHLQLLRDRRAARTYCLRAHQRRSPLGRLHLDRALTPPPIWPGGSRHRLGRVGLRPPRIRLRPGHRPGGRPPGTRPAHPPWPRCRGLSALVLIPKLPVAAVAVVLAVLSLGYDLTQPLLAGIVTTLGTRRGQAMGFNVFHPVRGLRARQPRL
jgi:hypothetical protein